MNRSRTWLGVLPRWVPMVSLVIGTSCELPEEDNDESWASETQGLLEADMADLQAGDVVTLAASHSGQCVTVLQASTQNGANIGQSTCADVDHQRFRVIDRGQGRISLQAVHSNKCIALRPGSGALNDRRNIEQQPCSSSDTTRMFVTTGTQGVSASLRNVASGRCMEVQSASLTVGANVRQRSCSSGGHQIFAMQPISSPPPVQPPPGGSPAGEFDIVVSFASPVSDAVRGAFERAASRWESVIVGDLPNATGGGQCGKFTVPSTVDDVVIFADIIAMDGRGGILGSAGPCRIRSSSQGYLPIAGSMSFDAVDLQAMDLASLENVILHEMGHVLGIGTLWNLRGYLELPTSQYGVGVDTHFSGPAAIEAFDDLGGTAYTSGAKVPVENQQGGAGTLDGHWRESVFVNELMTGFLNGGSNPLSAITIGSLSDLGYDTRLEAADAFTWPVTGFRSDAEAMPLVEELQVPLQIAQDNGEIVELGANPG